MLSLSRCVSVASADQAADVVVPSLLLFRAASEDFLADRAVTSERWSSVTGYRRHNVQFRTRNECRLRECSNVCNVIGKTRHSMLVLVAR
ncbi:hypothetical protein HBH56_082490 [Parastagonospora nodorum]|uniref:Uncharacterized protein n=1 Tax=Phaeosphaeria nodorum (strain SN15 / ATCC MYA-4574 / FGSC 10173) TaxID=321614 RepID=A0A7U2F122_PHANO|nr:hypothetical protein HBH56_082490 [Parastagonospora nodorum]QRC96662.1 hypothetical protein JI435_409380 [Parastagonospora nodorum SN15]KAH3929693.1 hypothetical protein HBH54_119350 [Parastagonospora nodorum]KAH3982525.1 hypothetical protein HBH52_078110 [Parastagonospora nodorum]KAH4007475.1 hypothetical protein HBI10_004170 [Parastagonospora nodorum]